MPLFALTQITVIPSLLISLKFASPFCNRFLMIDLLSISRDSPVSLHACLSFYIGFLLLHTSHPVKGTYPHLPILPGFVTPYVGPPRLPPFTRSALWIVLTFLFLV